MGVFFLSVLLCTVGVTLYSMQKEGHVLWVLDEEAKDRMSKCS